ncbi:MAG TPA: zinc ribbon domain-containing protein [Clostridia bacterium]|nr:zinc ribbon domain-containing protein [Clostridia bacterium]
MKPEGTQLEVGGAEPFAVCTICNAEFDTGQGQCPHCNVALSVVRRCPGCDRLVSAKHTKCLYCSQPFIRSGEEKQERASAESVRPASSYSDRRSKQYRAMLVSVFTFCVVFGLGLATMRYIERRDAITVPVIATTYALHAIDIKRSASPASSTAGNIGAGSVVSITGFEAADTTHRWLKLHWKGAPGYVDADSMAPPKAAVAESGFEALKFYLLGLAQPDLIGDAVEAVDYYGKAFPGNPHVHELRWIVAERGRYLAQRGKLSKDWLRKTREQYEQVAASDNAFAEKARAALTVPITAIADTEEPRSRPSKPQRAGLQILDSRSTGQSNSSPAHEIVIVNRGEVFVQTPASARLDTGSVLQGRVARPVWANGVLAIPSGTRCDLKVVSGSAAEANAVLQLTAIEVGGRKYPVNSSPIELRKTNRTALTRALVFQLDAPLAIVR